MIFTSYFNILDKRGRPRHIEADKEAVKMKSGWQQKWWIDCDPGIDDLAALLFAFAAPSFSIQGVSSVSGNVDLERSSRNLGRILRLCGQEVLPFYRGAARPMKGEPVRAEYAHGADGLWGIDLGVEGREAATDRDAADAIAEAARTSGPAFGVLALGPLTDLGLALSRYPELRRSIREIVLMGGGCRHGNVTPLAEFNIYSDPCAASIVFQSGIPIRMIGLDVTEQADVPAFLFEEENFSFKQAIIRRVAAVSRDLNVRQGLGGHSSLHDLTALLALLNPEAFDFAEARITVGLEAGPHYGQTICSFAKERRREPEPPVHRVALQVHQAAYEKVWSRLFRRLV